MNTNTIPTRVKVTACCLAGVIFINGSSVVSDAAMIASAPKIASIVEEAAGAETTLISGVSLSLSKYFKETSEQAAKPENEKGQDTESQTTKTQAVENDVPVVKSEFADIGVANVDEDSYINIRSSASTDSEIVGKLYSKSAVTVLGTEGEWYRIHSGNCEGYIKSEYIITGDEELAKSISTRVAISNTDNLNIRDTMSMEGQVLGQVNREERLLVIEETDKWVKVYTEEGEGYVSAEYVRCRNLYKVAESIAEEEARLRREEEARVAASINQNTGSLGQNTESVSANHASQADIGAAKTYNPPTGGTGRDVVNYASQFVGNPYVYGGESLTNGADCSGFIKSVYAAFGVSLPHSSRALRNVGYEVSQWEMQPGDIICYSGHVAIYVGNDTVVHASSASTGIKYTSPASYRSIITVRRIF